MNTLYDSGKMDIGGKRGRTIITRTAKGIKVKYDSLYSDAPVRTEYYRDGNYPQLPESWNTVINDYMTTEADSWLHNLSQYTPNRTTR